MSFISFLMFPDHLITLAAFKSQIVLHVDREPYWSFDCKIIESRPGAPNLVQDLAVTLKKEVLFMYECMYVGTYIYRCTFYT